MLYTQTVEARNCLRRLVDERTKWEREKEMKTEKKKFKKTVLTLSNFMRYSRIILLPNAVRGCNDRFLVEIVKHPVVSAIGFLMDIYDINSRKVVLILLNFYLEI